MGSLGWVCPDSFNNQAMEGIWFVMVMGSRLYRGVGVIEQEVHCS